MTRTAAALLATARLTGPAGAGMPTLEKNELTVSNEVWAAMKQHIPAGTGGLPRHPNWPSPR